MVTVMNKIDQIIRLSEMGYEPEPTIGKRPVRAYAGKPTLTQEEIQEYFQDERRNVATRCRNMTIIDADTPEAVEWAAKHIRTKRIVQTRRGFHYHIKKIIYPSAQNLFGIGLDIRNNESLAMIPPSEGYRWVSWGPLGELTTQLPEREQKRPEVQPVQAETTGVKMARGYLSKMDPAVSGQNGHATCFRAACAVADRVSKFMAPEEALFLIQEWNEKNQPPFSDTELLHKLQDAWKR